MGECFNLQHRQNLSVIFVIAQQAMQEASLIKIFNHYFQRHVLLQIFLDFTLIVGALIFLLVLYPAEGALNTAAVLNESARGVFIGLTVVLVNVMLGLYDGISKMSSSQLRSRAALSFVFSIIIIYSILSSKLFNSFVQHNQAIVGLVLVVGCMLAVRVFSVNLFPIKHIRRRILIFGAGERAHAIGKELQKNDASIELIGYFAGLKEHASRITESRVFSTSQTLTDAVKNHQIDEIVVALSERRGGSMPMRELLDCKLRGTKVIDISTHFEQSTGQIRLDALSAGWLIFSGGFNQGMVRSAVKWLFDMVASVILLVLALPVMLVTAVFIYLESSGPIFYRQERVGRNGEVFNVIKFRSMRNDAEKDGTPRWASAGDARITRVGKFIRKMRIDELPQLFCVLKGDMSLVGPRPERPYFVERLTQDIPYYAVRHSIKPGLTGWAQVRYHYSTSVEETGQKLQYDLYYVKNHSWFLDLVILFETVGVVLTGKGAQ